MRDIDVTGLVFCELATLGVRVAIDDFGTGQASFQYLQRFPFDVMKIDRCFVSGLDTDCHQGYLVEAILKLAARLGIEAVAEGVETADEANALRELGCELAQGFFIARPGSLEAITVPKEHDGVAAPASQSPGRTTVTT
jgi:EAL domain-containing protein (putative c-di-GMP-specific phosphodiesterase class I)